MTEDTLPEMPGNLAGSAEMSTLVGSLDWSTTPLGPIRNWSPSLRLMVSFLLANRFPLLLWWGSQYISIYNDAYRPILGNKHPRALGLPFAECWPEIRHILEPLIDTPFNGGPATWMEDILLEVNRHGFFEETHFTIAYSPVPDDTAPQGIGGVLATVHEITEKVVAERRVAALQRLGARAIEAKTAEEVCVNATMALAEHPLDVPFALLYLLDPDGKRARLAGSAGIKDGEVLGASVVTLDEPLDGAHLGWPLEDAVRSMAMITVENFLERFPKAPPGPWSDPPRAAVVLPIRSNKPNEVAGLLVAGVSSRLRLDTLYCSFFELVAGQIAASIASARAYEEERRRAEALAEIDRLKTTFFSNVSHEFRTPLTLMLGPLEGALGNPELPLPVREHLEVARRNSLRLMKLVNSLLDFSRIEAGRLSSSYEPTDLATLTTGLASVFRSAVERAGVKLIVDCPPLSSVVYVDREMWEKITLNLVSNAFKFTFEGEIEVSLREIEHAAVLSVRDTGIGIPPQELPRIFDRFHQVRGARGRSYEGSGIGLALVQELVRLHGGTIDVESTVDRGSRFTVTVPLGRSHLPADRIGNEHPLLSTAIRSEAFVQEVQSWLPEELVSDPLFDSLPDRAAGRRGAGQRVLVADDNADMREYVRRLLTNNGYQVDAVANGLAALRAARQGLPDLMLTDVMMPGLDGLGLVREMRGDPQLRSTPVILLSARAGEEARVEGMRAGADDYLVKPFSARELLARVQSLLDLQRVRQEAEIAVRKSEERLRALIRAGTYAIYRMSADWREMLELEGQGFIDETQGPHTDWLAHYVCPEDQPHVREAIQRAIATKSLFELEHRVRRIDGTLRWTLSRAVPLLDGNGQIIEWFGAASDVTDRKNAETALRDLNETLEGRVATELAARMNAEADLRQAQKMEAIGQLTGGIAHDFNNLLTVVMGGLERIQHAAPPDNERLLRAAESALEGARRAATLTHRLLAFSRRQPLDPQPTSVNRLVSETSALLHRTLGEAIELEAVLAPRIWPIDVDRNQLENTLLNLAINARDAMPDGGKLTIETANTHLDESYVATTPELQAGQYVMISVSDTGCGMTAEVLDHVFEPFFTTKGPGRGTGLGLSQVYGFIKQSGGHVRIYSESEQGTTVRLYLPRYNGELPADPPSAADRMPPRATDETILVVEDDDQVRSHTSELLRDLGYQTLEAADVSAAMQIVEAAEHFDLLFTDVMLPGGRSGRQLAELVLARRPGVKVLYTTGYARSAIVHHGRLDPGTALITKPFATRDLAAKIRSVLDE